MTEEHTRKQLFAGFLKKKTFYKVSAYPGLKYLLVLVFKLSLKYNIEEYLEYLRMSASSKKILNIS